MEQRQVVIIGAGLAGLTAGSLLAKRGYRVLLIEESAFPGGRARVMEKDGFILEYGIHSYRYAEKSSAHKVMTELGLNPEWIKEDHRSFLIKGKDLYPIPGGQERLGEDAKRYFHQPEIGKVKEAMEKLVAEKPEKWFRKSLADFLGDLLKDEKVLLLIRLIGLQIMEPDPKKASAGELIIHLRRAFEAGVGSAQLKGSSRIFIDQMVSTILNSGGEIKFGCRALALEMEKGLVKSVDTSEGEFKPEVLVYAGPLAYFLRLAGPAHFPEKFVKKVKRLEPVSGVAMDFALREKVSEIPGWMIEPELGILGKFPSNLDPPLAPAGKQLGSWVIILPPDQMSDPEEVRAGIHQLRSQIKKIFPDFFALVEWERILALPIIDGAALTHKQSLEDRPGIEAPGIENLFLAGDSVAAPGASGEIAVASGIKVAEKVAGYLGGKLI